MVVERRSSHLRLFLAPTRCSWRSLWCRDRWNRAHTYRKGAREGRRAWIASGVVLGALVVFFKVQIFAAAFPLLFSFAVVAWPPRRRWRWLVLGVCVVAGITLLPLANRFYVGPNVRFDFSGSDWYWKMLANMASGTPVESWYQIFSVGHPFPSHLAQAIGLTPAQCFGNFCGSRSTYLASGAAAQNMADIGGNLSGRDSYSFVDDFWFKR